MSSEIINWKVFGSEGSEMQRQLSEHREVASRNRVAISHFCVENRKAIGPGAIVVITPEPTATQIGSFMVILPGSVGKGQKPQLILKRNNNVALLARRTGKQVET